jgi:hypothetical protein
MATAVFSGLPFLPRRSPPFVSDMLGLTGGRSRLMHTRFMDRRRVVPPGRARRVALEFRRALGASHGQREANVVAEAFRAASCGRLGAFVRLSHDGGLQMFCRSFAGMEHQFAIAASHWTRYFTVSHISYGATARNNLPTQILQTVAVCT